MPLIDGINTFPVQHAPDLQRDEIVMLDKQNMQAFCKDMDLPMFKLKGVTFKYGIVEEKTALNMLFTRFSGIWIMAYEEGEGGENDGQ
jgi:hypothetical protein